MWVELSNEDALTIVNGLRVAAERFDGHAVTTRGEARASSMAGCHCVGDTGRTPPKENCDRCHGIGVVAAPPPIGLIRVAEQFEKQSADSRRLACLIEEKCG